jgi:predicted TPR repeat methyltransferase
MSKHDKYQDYVIKNGKLIGKFEQMYQKFDDPWEQTTRETYAIEKSATLEIIKEKGFKRVLEYGCGFGDFTNRIKSISDSALGVDISKTAIKKAKQKYPHVDFKTGDILDFNILEKYQPDCIVFAEISWYVLDKLEEFKRHLKSNVGG